MVGMQKLELKINCNAWLHLKKEKKKKKKPAMEVLIEDLTEQIA